MWGWGESAGRWPVKHGRWPPSKKQFRVQVKPWIITMKRLIVRAGCYDVPFSGFPGFCQNLEQDTALFVFAVPVGAATKEAVALTKPMDIASLAEKWSDQAKEMLPWAKLSHMQIAFIPAGHVPIFVGLRDYAAFQWVPLLNTACMASLDLSVKSSVFLENLAVIHRCAADTSAAALHLSYVQRTSHVPL